MLPEDDLDELAVAKRIAEERARWGAPFTAWRLGDQARDLPEGERGPILDRAIDELAAIALTPVSPGNDEGPIWALGRMLDEPRVRRALTIVDHMESADWKGDLCAARASLIARLALLGHADEAEQMIPRIGIEEGGQCPLPASATSTSSFEPRATTSHHRSTRSASSVASTRARRWGGIGPKRVS